MTTRKAKEETGNGNFWKTPVWEVTKPVAVGIVVFFAGAIGDKILSGAKVDEVIPRVEVLETNQKKILLYIEEVKRKKDYDSGRLAERKQFYKEQLEQQRRNDSLMRLDERQYDKDMIEAISKPIEIITR